MTRPTANVLESSRELAGALAAMAGSLPRKRQNCRNAIPMKHGHGPGVDPSQNGERQDVLNEGGRSLVPPTLSGHVVEAPVMGLVVFLVGIATALTGAFIRSCESIPAELLHSWCGSAPQSLAFGTHQHCAGCVLMASGFSLIVLAPLLTRRRLAKAVRAVSR
jgi:hypothetical protein